MATMEGDAGGDGFLRRRLKSAFHTSNEVFSNLSVNISNRLSVFSMTSLGSSEPSPPPVDDKNIGTATHFQLPQTNGQETPNGTQHRSPTMTKMIKDTFRLENLKELRPALEEFMLPDSSTEPSTLPTNTPESPKAGFRFHMNKINQAIPKRLVDYKKLAIRTLSGDGPESQQLPSCAINVEFFDSAPNGINGRAHSAGVPQMSGNKAPSTCFSSRSFNSLHSLRATGPDPYDKLRYRPEIISSGTPSDGEGLGHSTSMDSTDSDPNKKLWIREGSQASLRSWASSLSYDSQAEEVNETKDFIRSYVEDIFKIPQSLEVDRKAHFGELAQTETGRLWFARCINAKRCCSCVTEATFFSLVQHFSVTLFECAEADDFSPAKSLMNMCFTYYHDAMTPGGVNRRKEFLYVYLRQQPIWRTLRFWNAAFFDALQCERSLYPVVTREEVECNRMQAVTDELHYHENITFGQLGTFTCNMHAFGLSKEMVIEFLRKQVTIASLRSDQVSLLKGNVERLFSETPNWL